MDLEKATSKLQKLGYRYLKGGEQPPEFSHVITSRKGKKLYKRFKHKLIYPDKSKTKDLYHKEGMKELRKQVRWANNNFDQVNQTVKNLFENNTTHYPIVNHTVHLPEEGKYVFINSITRPAFKELVSKYPEHTLVFMGDVLTDKRLFTNIMKIKAATPNRIMFTAFAGPYQKLSYVFNDLPFDAKAGKFLVTRITTDPLQGYTVFNPDNLHEDHVAVFDGEKKTLSFDSATKENQNAK